MRILDLTGSAAEQFPGATVDTTPENAPYDVIVTRGHLSAAFVSEALSLLTSWGEVLENGGELHLMEPSGEWAAREIRAGHSSIPLMMHLYGDADNPRHCLYTLEQLRASLEETGFRPVQAITRLYNIARSGNGEVFQGEQHYVVAVKRGEARGWIPS